MLSDYCAFPELYRNGTNILEVSDLPIYSVFAGYLICGGGVTVALEYVCTVACLAVRHALHGGQVLCSSCAFVNIIM